MHAQLTRGALVAALVLGITGSAAAQSKFALELHGGINVPTFDIADAVKAGPSFGGGVVVEIAPRWSIMGEIDFGSHSGADLPGGGEGPDVDVSHFIGKVGYTVYRSADGKLALTLNLGAGALRFDVDGASSANTYFAINAGGKLTYALGRRVMLVLSPQGDIAFTKESEIGTSNAWVWPVSAGFRFQL